MSDERLEKLGTYFVHRRIRERFGITFARFVELVDAGTWSAWIAS